MAEKYTYGPLIFNHFGDEDDSGNYWWNGPSIIGYEQPEGIWKIPVDERGNQCLPGECILHPTCRVERFTSHPVLGDVPDLGWCREWFEDNFLDIDDWTICRYIIRWYNNQHRHDEKWLSWKRGKRLEQMIGEIWPDVHKS